MNIQHHEIHDACLPQVDVIAAMIKRGIEACATHERPATVTVSYKIKRDKHSPHIVVLESICKVKEPKSDKTDLSGKTDTETLGRWDAEEEDGRQTIGEGT